eukprot:SAG22_NODE_4_length_44774_cov_362.122149_25_plen_85_part_00
MCDKQMTMVIASSWVQDKIVQLINEPDMKDEEKKALVEISDHIHKQKQLTDDLKKIKDIVSIFDYEPNDDDDHINNIKQIIDKY